MNSTSNETADAILKDIDALFQKLARVDLPVDVEMEIGKIMNLVHAVQLDEKKKKPKISNDESRLMVLTMLRHCLQALEANIANVSMAKSIRREAAHVVKNRCLAKRLFYRAPSSVKIVIGLVVALLIVGFGIGFYFRIIGECGLTARWSILTAILFGVMGGVVSTLYRIKALSDANEDETSLLFFSGFLKPFIGIGFALFIYVLHKSGLLPIIHVPETLAGIAVLSFIAGFSERFVSDIIDKTIDTNLNKNPRPSPSGNSADSNASKKQPPAGNNSDATNQGNSSGAR